MGGMILTEENGIRRNTCPRPTRSTTNPTYIGMGSKTDLRSEKPATTSSALAWPCRSYMGTYHGQ